MKKKCIVINMVGAPGAGKSTGAAYVFSQLKMKGINVELITEFAKRKVWEQSFDTLSNQAYVFGKQYHSMFNCRDKVDVIVTDSPLFLSIFYNKDEILGECFNQTVMNVFNSFTNINFFLNRVKPYNPKGRMQTEKESDKYSKQILALMDGRNIPYYVMNGCEESYQFIASYVEAFIKNPEGHLDESKDYYFYHPSTKTLNVLYFNPDGNGGLGQIVEDVYSIHEIRDKAFLHPLTSLYEMDWDYLKRTLDDNPLDWPLKRELIKSGYIELPMGAGLQMIVNKLKEFKKGE